MDKILKLKEIRLLPPEVLAEQKQDKAEKEKAVIRRIQAERELEKAKAERSGALHHMFDEIAVMYWRNRRSSDEYSRIENLVNNEEDQLKAIELLKSKKLKPGSEFFKLDKHWTSNFSMVEDDADLDWLDKHETGEKALIH